MKHLNDVNYKDCVGKVDPRAYKALMNYTVDIDD